MKAEGEPQIHHRLSKEVAGLAEMEMEVLGAKEDLGADVIECINLKRTRIT